MRYSLERPKNLPTVEPEITELGLACSRGCFYGEPPAQTKVAA